MVKGKETSIDERNIIIKLHSQGKSQREIAKVVGRSQSTINNIIKRFHETGSVGNKARSGRPRKVCQQLRRIIIREIKTNPKVSAPKLCSNIATAHNVHVSSQTVRNIIKQEGYHGRVARKKFYVNKVNRKKRLDFAIHYSDMPQSYWNKVLWSDESKFQLFHSNRRSRVWRKKGTELDPKHLTPTVKHGGGSVMVWGCMSV